MDKGRLYQFIAELKEIIKEEERQLKAQKKLNDIIRIGNDNYTDLVAKLSQESIDFISKQKEDEIAFYKNILARAEAELKKAQ